jgi:hypothetical protein
VTSTASTRRRGAGTCFLSIYCKANVKYVTSFGSALVVFGSVIVLSWVRPQWSSGHESLGTVAFDEDLCVSAFWRLFGHSARRRRTIAPVFATAASRCRCDSGTAGRRAIPTRDADDARVARRRR